MKAAERLGLRPTASHSGETAGTAAVNAQCYSAPPVQQENTRIKLKQQP